MATIEESVFQQLKPYLTSNSNNILSFKLPYQEGNIANVTISKKTFQKYVFFGESFAEIIRQMGQNGITGASIQTLIDEINKENNIDDGSLLYPTIYAFAEGRPLYNAELLQLVNKVGIEQGYDIRSASWFLMGKVSILSVYLSITSQFIDIIDESYNTVVTAFVHCLLAVSENKC